MPKNVKKPVGSKEKGKKKGAGPRGGEGGPEESYQTGRRKMGTLSVRTYVAQKGEKGGRGKKVNMGFRTKTAWIDWAQK